MVQPVAPRVALVRWLAQIHYNAIRNIEASFPNGLERPLRGFKIADDLVLTRKRVFYRIAGPNAVALSVEEVSANYNLKALQAAYRSATESWKTSRRQRSQRSA
jgi:hypothetical protein